MLTEFLLKEKPRACSQLLSVDLTGVLYDKVSRPFPCGAGESRVTYDCDGRKYSCHLLSPLVLTAEEQEAYGKAENRAFSESGRCKTCPLDAICPRCDANSFRFFGRFGEREDAMCELFRHQVLHACRYQTKAILARAGAARGETERAGTGEAGAAERDRLTIVAVNKIMRRGSDVFAGQNPGAFR